MQSNLKAVTAAGIQRCREDGRQCDAVEVAYIACLLEEQQAWCAPAAPASTAASSTAAAAAATAPPEGGDAPLAEEPPVPQLPQQQQQQKLSLCSGARLSETALAAMAERLRQELVNPADPASAPTARLQVALERSYKEQQDKVEAEHAQHTGTTSRLASAVAYKKVNMQAAGLPLYQTVFGRIVEYVCAAAGLEAKAASDPDARAQVSAAVESVLPLSSLAYFLTLPAQERMQQMESLAAISCGICLFNSHTGNAPSPVTLSADTQLLQAGRLLADIQTAAAQAEAALDHYNAPQQHTLAATNPALAAAAAAYLGSSSSGSAAGAGAANSSSESAQLGAVLFCCQAAVALRTLADLSAGISCCRQLHNELLSVLSQAAQVTVEMSGAAVPKEQVFPLFESAGRMHLALKGELRLLLVRGRLWEAACDALAAAEQQPGVPKVLGFRSRRHLGSSMAGSSTGGSIRASTAALAAPAAVVFDASSLPADMEYVPCVAAALAAAAAAAGEELGEGLDIVGGTGAVDIPPAEQQVLALSGMCPVSIAGSVAAGGAAAGLVNSAAGAEAAAEARPLLGHLARSELGVIRYAGKLYGFSSPAALAAFVSGPESVLDAVRQAAHNAPLLLHTLALSTGLSAAAPAGGCPSSSASVSASANGNVSVGGYNSSPGSTSSSPVNGVSGAGSTGGYRGSSAGTRRSSAGGDGVKWRLPPLRGLLELFTAPLKVNAGTQTVTHIVEHLIDIDYEWNEWALRRRIIALANLRQKATHSAQTLSSGFRREGCSQTWLPKEAAVQTKVNKGSSVPKKLRYVTGLRGAPETKMKVVSLELDVHGKGANVKPGRLQ